MTMQEYCLSKNGAYEDRPFGIEPAVIKVGSKLFAIISNNSISLKCEPFTADHLRYIYPAVKPAYHLNKEHWNTVTLNDTVPDDELKWMLDHSYEFVFNGLNKAERDWE